MTQTVYLSLGSNLGERERNLRAAVGALSGELRIGAISSLYDTAPVGVTDQPPFLNLALRAETELTPSAVLELVKRVEREVGRRPTYRWGPRVVDIDIILFGDLVVEQADLMIPHAQMEHRAFVLVPLAEIAPEVRHPVLHRTVEELVRAAPGLSDVRRIGPYRDSKRSSTHGSPSM